MTQKGFAHILLVLVILILVIASGFIFIKFGLKNKTENTNQQAQDVQVIDPKYKEIENVPIVFQSQGKVIFKKNAVDKDIREIGIGESPALSPDGTKIAFVKDDPDGIYRNVFLYDIASKATEQFSKEDLARQIVWSPTGKYLLINSGTSAIGSTTIYNAQTKQSIASFVDKRGDYSWLPDESALIINDLQERANAKRSDRYESSELSTGISKISLPNGQKQILIEPTSLDDYQLIGILDNKIIYTKTSVKTPEDWGSDNLTSVDSKLSMDINAQNTVACEGCNVTSDNTSLKTKLNSSLNFKKDGLEILEFKINPKYKNWVLFTTQQIGTIKLEDNNMYIVNIDDPEKTILLIGKGRSISW